MLASACRVRLAVTRRSTMPMSTPAKTDQDSSASSAPAPKRRAAPLRDRAQLQGTAILAHEMPPPTTIRVDKVGGTINWSAVPDIDHYVIELELEAEGKDDVKLSFDAPSDMTSITTGLKIHWTKL